MAKKRTQSAMTDEWWEAMVLSYQKAGGDLSDLKSGLVQNFIRMAIERNMMPAFAGYCIARIQRGVIRDEAYIRDAIRAFVLAGGQESWLSHDAFMPSLASFYAMDFDPDHAGRELAEIIKSKSEE